MKAAMTSVPMIPGLVSDHRTFLGRTNFHKGHVLEQMANGRFQNEPPPPRPLTPPAKSNQVQDATIVQSKGQSSRSTAFRSDAKTPAWITHDRQVLRFYGFFRESIAHATSTEDRIRRLILLYYLSDKSLAISEPRVANSGLAQGEFLKRTVALTTNGVPFSPRDFTVGGSIRLHGRHIHLVDCDAATRTYYDDAVGVPQGPACKYPDDTTSQLDEVAELKTRLKQQTAHKTESAAARVRQFHAFSDRVLRFFVAWDDPHPLYPETRHYVLHYYLCDDTLEIVEPRHEREGRGHFAVLLSRRRLPIGSSNHYVHARDLRCGESLVAFGRRFLLLDCDAFTRAFYTDTHGITQEPQAPEARAKKEHAAKWKLFQVDPKNVLEKIDKPRSKPPFSETEESGDHVLRFRARFHGLAASDANATRSFVVTYYLEDDTFAVFEPPVKNAGILGGRFLDRGRFRKCDTTTSSYNAGDFYVGAVIAFAFAPQQKLELLEADRQTLAFCESQPQRFPFSNIHAVLETLAKATTLRSTAIIRRAFRTADTARNGTLGVSHVRKVLERLGLTKSLNAQQLVTLCRRFEETDGGEATLGPLPFLYDDFCDALALATRPSSASNDVVERLRAVPVLRRLLREADVNLQRVVDARHMGPIANAYGLELTARDVETLATRFRGSDRQPRGAIDYTALCDAVFDGDDVQRPTAYDEGRDDDVQSNDAFDDDNDNEGDASAPPMDVIARAVKPSAHAAPPVPPFSKALVSVSPAPPPLLHAPRSKPSADARFPQPPVSPRRAMPPAPPFPKPPMSARSAPPALANAPRGVNAPATPVPPIPTVRAPGGSAPLAPPGPSTDVRVVSLLRRVFGDCKYKLRKALRERDVDKTGILEEEAFMDAVLSLAPDLSDDDTYLIADVYFPTNNSHVDYAKLLERAFRT